MKKNKIIASLFLLPALFLKLSSIKLNATQPQTDKVIHYSYSEDFKQYDVGYDWQRQAIYLEDATGVVVNDDSFDDNSLKIIPSSQGWSVARLKYGTTRLQNSTYSLLFKCKTSYIDAINIEVARDYRNNFYAEYGIAINNDGTSISYRKGNLNLEESEVLNPIRSVENGIITIGFDFICQDNYGLINICLHSNSADAYMLIDDINIYDKNNGVEDFKIVYYEDFNSKFGYDVFNSTPFWCSNGSFSFYDDNGNKKLMYSGNYYNSNGDNVPLGGLTRVELTTLRNKLYHYSYDVELENVQELVITTLDDCGNGQNYSEITFNSLLNTFKVTAPGGIKNFKVNYHDGVYHLDYFRITSEKGNDEHFMYATSIYGKDSKVILDNILMSYKED